MNKGVRKNGRVENNSRIIWVLRLVMCVSCFNVCSALYMSTRADAVGGEEYS